MNEFHIKSKRSYVEHDIELLFEWYGGPYIGVRVPGQNEAEVINVWNYEKDEPRYPRTEDGFNCAIDSWVDSYGIDNLVHDVRENW